jgi:hypothetical protein
MNPDFVALLRELSAADARFLIVGAYALAHHARPRATGTSACGSTRRQNAPASIALARVRAPLTDLSETDLVRPDLVYQIGIAPRRIDILTSLTGLTFDEAWGSREAGRFGEAECFYIGREALIRNKRALGRARDLADLESLGQ